MTDETPPPRRPTANPGAVAGETDAYTVTGRVDPAHAGADAWAFDTIHGHRSVAAIDETGTFTLDLAFRDATRNTPVQLRTPEYTLTRPLGVLATGRVTLDGTLDG